MSGPPKSPLEAIDEMLTVLKERDHCSNASRLRGKRQREMLGEICRDTVNSAQGGDTEAAKRILHDFVRSVSQHSEHGWRGPNHYLYARYIADAFRQILENGDVPAIALGIKSSRPGRRKGAVTHDPIPLAAAYWLLHRQGIRPEKSIALLCEMTGADRTTVQKARKARFTSSYQHSDLVSDLDLEQRLANWPYAPAFLKVLRGARQAGRAPRE